MNLQKVVRLSSFNLQRKEGEYRMLHYAIEKQGQEIWLVEQQYEPCFALKTESVFAQCNGYMGVRASQSFSSLDEKRGMFIAGFFNRAYEEEATELVNCPDIIEIKLKIDGEDIYPDRTKILYYQRKFNIHTGELVTTIQFQLETGAEICVVDKRFASMYDNHLFAQKIIVTPIRGDIQQGELITGINGQQTNSGVTHFRKIDCRVYDKQFLHVKGYLNEDTISILKNYGYNRQGKEGEEFSLKRRGIFVKHLFSTPQNKSLEFENFVYIHKQEDMIDLESQKQTLETYKKAGYQKVFTSHQKKMKSLWNRANIHITGATLEEEAAISFALYHLFGMIPWQDPNSSIAAKGLTGEGYKGHVFWDTEIFLLPFFIYTFPNEARNLLKFRYDGLDGAREKAKLYGYEGAMFPWEVAKTGKEETPLYAALNIHTGKPEKVWSGIKEHHVTADIVYATWQYYSATGDELFMQNYGYEIIFEGATFWASRARWSKEKEAHVIEDIIGPDEYTEHIDNNAYSNYMAQYCTRLAADLAKKLQRELPHIYQQLDKKLKLEKNRKRWEDFFEKIYLPKPNAEQLIPQDDTFFSKKALPDIEKYKTSQIKQKILLDYSRDEIVDMQVLKQADVVMLLNLFPHLFSKEVVKENVLFYEKRTIHDSSLSYCTHAQACATIGEIELAWKFFKKCLVVDLNKNPTDSTDGIHAASLGGIWNCIIFGFAGISYDNGQLRIAPKLPKHWKEIKFKIQVEGSEILMRISNQEISLERLDNCEKPLPVHIYENDYLLENSLNVWKYIAKN